MLSKTSVDDLFMHHFEKISPASGAPTGELPLDPAGGLPSFRPLIANPWKKSCGRPWADRNEDSVNWTSPLCWCRVLVMHGIPISKNIVLI